MAAWQNRVEQLLYEGEEVLLQVGSETVRVVVTSHRVLVFTPESTGPNFRTVERPNVNGLASQAIGNARYLTAGVKALVVGLVLLVAGVMVDVEGLLGATTVDTSAAASTGIGDIVSIVSLLQRFLALLDDGLLVGGALLTLGGLGLLGVYYQTRENALVIEVAGGENIEFPANGLSESDRSKLGSALGRL